jgi:TfoX/Sxy family transcriptional regulator of competence genes
MPYDEKLADRIRIALEDVPHVEEKKMFRGVTFMVNDKMCISVSADRLMCRIGAAKQQEAVEKPGCTEVIMRGNVMKDFVYVSHDAFKNKKDFDYWIKLCLDFNKEAKSSKKKRK